MIIPLFPVMVHNTEVSNFKCVEEDLIKSAYNYRKKDPTGRVISNMGGWQSSFLKLGEENIIKSTIIKVISSYFHFNKIFDCDIKLDSLWININGKGHSNNLHHHPLADLSGVFWIKTPIDCGKIEFSSPHNFVQGKELKISNPKYAEDNNVFASYYFDPHAGSVLIFPSFLYHQVYPNNSNEDRISVSFNLLFHK